MFGGCAGDCGDTVPEVGMGLRRGRLIGVDLLCVVVVVLLVGHSLHEGHLSWENLMGEHVLLKLFTVVFQETWRGDRREEED